MIQIKKRERDAVLQSLQAGLVPKQGVHLIQVGRKAEVTALLRDIERIEEGGAGFRFVIAPFGAGKSFFCNLVRAVALQKKLVVAQADMTMERRLQATGGQARALFSELMKNLATKGRPDGNALRAICEGWISEIAHAVKSTGGTDVDVRKRIQTDLRDLQDYVGGYDFSEVLSLYYEGHVSGNDTLQGNALRWLRAEYTTKTEARQDLGVRTIIDDASVYDFLKLFASFCRKAGYAGLFVVLDEMVVLSHRLPIARARQANFEAILTMLNDCYQGGAEGIGFLLAGTTEFLEDKRRGLYSYEALRSRLAQNHFASEGVVDLSGPVIELAALTPEDLFVLLKNIRNVHASGDEKAWLVPDEALVGVLQKASEMLGAEYFRTPRDVVRSFVGLLNVLEQNPKMTWRELLDQGAVKPSAPISAEEEIAKGIGVEDDRDADMETFKL